MPNAPGLLSTTNCWPRLWRICSPNRRAVMSVAPPGAYGTTIFTGREGYLSCAKAVTPPNARHSSARPKPIRFITSSGEPAEIATPMGISLPSIVVQARGLKQAINRAMLSRRGQIAAQSSPPAKTVCWRHSSRRLDAVQAVGRILAREEHDIALGRGLAGVHDVGGNVDHRARFGLDLFLSNLGPKRALQNVDPLLVRVRMRLCAGAGRHPHQGDDHAVPLDAGAVGGRIVGAAEDVIHRGEIEHVFAVARALGTRRPRHLLRHFCLLRFPLLSHIQQSEFEPRQANARVLSPAPSKARARPPRMADCSAAEIDRPRTCDTPSGMPMSKG